MSVQSRLYKYWMHDQSVGYKIIKEAGGLGKIIKSADTIESVVNNSRFRGSMMRYHRAYKRLNAKHVPNFIKKMANKMADTYGQG